MIVHVKVTLGFLFYGDKVTISHIACLKDSKWYSHALCSKINMVRQLLSIKLFVCFFKST